MKTLNLYLMWETAQTVVFRVVALIVNGCLSHQIPAPPRGFIREPDKLAEPVHEYESTVVDREEDESAPAGTARLRVLAYNPRRPIYIVVPS